MGRKKIKIEKLNTSSKQRVTYSKRRMGLIKKARELSILCDVEVLLVMFSTKGIPTICLGEKSTFEELIQRYAGLSPQQRNESKLESIQALKVACKKLDNEVDIDQLYASRAPQNPPTPPNKADLTKDIEQAEEKFCQIYQNAGMLKSTGGLECLQNLVNHLLYINSQMKVARNGLIGCTGNRVLGSPMHPPNTNTNFRNANVFVASASASASTSTSAPVMPLPMPMQEESNLMMDPIFDPPLFNGTNGSYPSASAPLMAMHEEPNLMIDPIFNLALFNGTYASTHLNAGICDVDDSINLGMGNNDMDNSLARGGGNAGVA